MKAIKAAPIAANIAPPAIMRAAVARTFDAPASSTDCPHRDERLTRPIELFRGGSFNPPQFHLVQKSLNQQGGRHRPYARVKADFDLILKKRLEVNEQPFFARGHSRA